MKENLKKQIKDILSIMQKNVDEEKLSEIAKYSDEDSFELLRSLFSNLKYSIEMEKEEKRLRELFYTYIECVNNNTINECIIKYGITDEKTLMKSIAKFLKGYATEEEQYIYLNSKSKKIRDEYNNRKNVRYKENCMSYEYVQDVTKMLLYNNDNISILFDYYISKKLRPRVLSDHASRYIENANVCEKEKNIILEKVALYYRYYDEKKKKQNITISNNNEIEEETNVLLDNILKSKRSIRSYCEINHLNNKDTRQILYRIKRLFPEIYENFEKQLKENEIIESENNIKLVPILNQMIENGVEEDGLIRQFDIVDYYLLAKVSIENFIYSIRLTLKDEKYIVGLVTKLKRMDDKMNKSISDSYNYKKEKTISNDNYKIVIDESIIRDITEFLKINNIPINGNTYYAMENRYIEKKKKELNKSI